MKKSKKQVKKPKKSSKRKDPCMTPCENVQEVSRTLCDTLEEMRNLLKVVDESFRDSSMVTLSKTTLACLRSLVEEIQVYGSRMETHLYQNRFWERQKSQLKAFEAFQKELIKTAKDLDVDVPEEVSQGSSSLWRVFSGD